MTLIFILWVVILIVFWSEMMIVVFDRVKAANLESIVTPLDFRATSIIRDLFLCFFYFYSARTNKLMKNEMFIRKENTALIAFTDCIFNLQPLSAGSWWLVSLASTPFRTTTASARMTLNRKTIARARQPFSILVINVIKKSCPKLFSTSPEIHPFIFFVEIAFRRLYFSENIDLIRQFLLIHLDLRTKILLIGQLFLNSLITPWNCFIWFVLLRAVVLIDQD